MIEKRSFTIWPCATRGFVRSEKESRKLFQVTKDLKSNAHSGQNQNTYTHTGMITTRCWLVVTVSCLRLLSTVSCQRHRGKESRRKVFRQNVIMEVPIIRSFLFGIRIFQSLILWNLEFGSLRFWRTLIISMLIVGCHPPLCLRVEASNRGVKA